ncbi:hypothetical protein VHEMI08018 [[Torrubiella] hemipterigena]|uniref:HbrB-like protein n=1 Tax=[Torrubiella] hemipterigena TaxID=1531966 RepID=A0A0A1TNY4_9HYPO|nr:hypothetical protein VHEMI08018 [[Torrubiella] hemipterigena]
MNSSSASGSAGGQRSHSGRAPGSFSPLTSSSTSPNKPSQSPRPLSLTRRAPPPLNMDNLPSGNDGPSSATLTTPTISISKRSQRAGSPATPIYNQFASAASTSSLHNFSRPTGSPRVVTQGTSSPLVRGETRRVTATQGSFEPTMPSTSNQTSAAALTASQIAAQAAVMSHHKSAGTIAHSRQRSQTVPMSTDSGDSSRRSSGSKASAGHPSLQSAETAPSGQTNGGLGIMQMDRLGNANSTVATTAANVVFPRSGHTSPKDANQPPPSPLPLPPPIPVSMLEKPISRSEKAKSKLFSRTPKMPASKSDSKEKALPSPSKIGSALSALQRANFSTSSLVDSSNSSIYSLGNSSSATIRPADSMFEDKTKEKKHNFLSRQKQKLKDEYHLSSVASNSRPTDPSAPSSLYNFHLPSLPTATSKSKKDKRFERSESRLDNESTFNFGSDWNGGNAFPSLSQTSTQDSTDHGRLGLQPPNGLEEALPYLKKVVHLLFDHEDIRTPIEDINRVVQMHIQLCVHRRTPELVVEDFRDLLGNAFASLDQSLRTAGEDRFLPTLVDLWLFTFATVLPYLQAVFLPLDMEVAGHGSIIPTEQARTLWQGTESHSNGQVRRNPTEINVRMLVLKSYRDLVVLPRYDTLKTIFSRLSLEFLPASLSATPGELTMSTSPPEFFPPMAPMARPGTAASLDPSVASYNSTSSTAFGDSGSGSGGGRSRAVSNVSYVSHASDGHRPFTPGGHQTLSSVREQNVESSKAVTELAGRMLQCMSVLSGLGGTDNADDEARKKLTELCRMLKLNWLGRGRTGRNRRGIVGGRVKRGDAREEVRVA